MTSRRSCLYEGKVVHKRLVPRPHAFGYRVFALCLDVDEIEALDRDLRLFSRGRRNVLSFWDGDFGEPGSIPIGDKIRQLLARCGLAEFGVRIEVVCYPRLLGYVFNPLSVYFCRAAGGDLGAIVYEVSNTFDERKSYILPLSGATQGCITGACPKEMYVSPFTAASGSYGFHGIPPADRVVIGVNFREEGRPVLKTHFRAERRPLDDRTIARLTATHPLMTLKVIGAIHLEAARLWAKGVPVVARHASPAYSFTLVERPAQGPQHA